MTPEQPRTAADVERSAKALALIVIRDRQAHDRIEPENRWTLPEPLWMSLDDYQRIGWRVLAREYARLAAPPDPVASRQRWDYDGPHPFESKDLGSPTYDFCICERRRTDAMHLPDPVASPPEAVRLLRELVARGERINYDDTEPPPGYDHWRLFDEALNNAHHFLVRFLEGAVATQAPLDVEALADLDVAVALLAAIQWYVDGHAPSGLVWPDLKRQLDHFLTRFPQARLEGQPVAEDCE